MQDQKKTNPAIIETKFNAEELLKTSLQNPNSHGRWIAVHRTRLPHKTGLPLSSGGCGDSMSR